MFHTLMFAFFSKPKKTSGWEISATVKKEHPIIRHNTTLNSQTPKIIKNYQIQGLYFQPAYLCCVFTIAASSCCKSSCPSSSFSDTFIAHMLKDVFHTLTRWHEQLLHPTNQQSKVRSYPSPNRFDVEGIPSTITWSLESIWANHLYIYSNPLRRPY